MAGPALPFPRIIFPPAGHAHAHDAKERAKSGWRQVLDPPQEQSDEISGDKSMDAHHCIKLLKQLGDTPEAVAHSLRILGIQGVRNTVRFLNPIIRFLQSHISDESIELDLIEGTAVTAKTRDRRTERIPLPEAVRTFLEAFHRGEYPNCELPPEK